MSSPLRVLQIVGAMNRAGAESMLMNLYREIDRAEVQFDFVYFTNEACDFDNEITHLGGRIIRLQEPTAIGRFRELYRLLRSNQWQVVHSHTLLSSGIHLLAAKLARIPRRIAHSHSAGDLRPNTFLRRVYRSASLALLSWIPTDRLACGEKAAEFLFRNKNDVTIFPNAINIARFQSADRELVGSKKRGVGSELRIVQIGRFLDVKNHAFSLRVCEELARIGIDFQMSFVGDGPLKPSIDEEIRFRALSRQVRSIGAQKNIPEIMADADVLLMPSIHEGFPVVLVESQASGLPAVVSASVSREVDLGIDLVDFADLSEPPAVWAQMLVDARNRNVPDRESRFEVLKKLGFSASDNAAALANLYRTT